MFKMNRWKTTSISLLVSIVFAIACYFMPSKLDLFWSIIISVLTFLISYIFIELLNCTNKIKDSNINSEYKFFKECGIAEYSNDFSKIDFDSHIRGASNIKIMLLYSDRFLTRYIDALQQFVSKDNANLTVVILTDKEEQNAYRYVTEKFGYEEDRIKNKVSDFINILQKYIFPYKNNTSKIRLYNTEYIPAYTLYMFDNYAYISLYKTAPQRTNLIPCFRVEKSKDSSFFDFLFDDFNDIVHTATPYKES